jgi:transposase
MGALASKLSVKPKAPSPKIGRPKKLTSQFVKKFTALIRDGNYPECAAMASGISARTYYRWMEQGCKDEKANRNTEFFQFCQSVKKAGAQAQVQLVANVFAAASKHWQAAMTMLERRWPDQWGKRERVDQTSPEGEPLDVQHRGAVVILPDNGHSARKFNEPKKRHFRAVQN